MNAANAPVERHVVVRGRVQGVSFRAFVADRAMTTGIEGWVRNRHDGCVEAVFVGPSDLVTQMIAACRCGPPAARVEAVEENTATAADLSQRRTGEVFSVLPTV